MAGLRSALLFLVQSVVAGLAVAFVVVLVRPDLLPAIGGERNQPPASYADAVDVSAPSVVTVITRRLVQGAQDASGRTPFRISTSYASAVIIDPDGYLVTNYQPQGKHRGHRGRAEWPH